MRVKVFYKNVGDTSVSFISEKLSLERPDDLSFEAEVESFKHSFRYRIDWINDVPSVEQVGDKSSTRELEEALLAIDSEVQEADRQPFPYGGGLYYPDTEFIQGIFSVLPYLPVDYTETWKTAEKDTDGVKNKKVVLDKAGIVGLALAYLQFKKTNWAVGEAKKEQLKDAFLAGE